MNFVYQKSLVEQIKNAKRNAPPGRPLIKVEVSGTEFYALCRELGVIDDVVLCLHVEGVLVEVDPGTTGEFVGSTFA